MSVADIVPMSNTNTHTHKKTCHAKIYMLCSRNAYLAYAPHRFVVVVVGSVDGCIRKLALNRIEELKQGRVQLYFLNFFFFFGNHQIRHDKAWRQRESVMRKRLSNAGMQYRAFECWGPGEASKYCESVISWRPLRGYTIGWCLLFWCEDAVTLRHKNNDERSLSLHIVSLR